MMKPLLRRAGLLPAARMVRRGLQLVIDPAFRADERSRAEEFAGFKREFGGALAYHQMNGVGGSQPVALVAGRLLPVLPL